MNRWADVYYRDSLAGILVEDDQGYTFTYDARYCRERPASPVSITLPVRLEAYRSATMFPFFDGLIPEGWMLNVTFEVWKINPRDRMGLLLACCRDTIGAVHIIDRTGSVMTDDSEDDHE